MFHHEDLQHDEDDALAPSRGCVNTVGLSVAFFWAPLALAIAFLTWWRA